MFACYLGAQFVLGMVRTTAAPAPLDFDLLWQGAIPLTAGAVWLQLRRCRRVADAGRPAGQTRQRFPTSDVVAEIIFGVPRSATKPANSRATHRPDIDVWTTLLGHSRVTCSSPFSTRRHRPWQAGPARNSRSSADWTAPPLREPRPAPTAPRPLYRRLQLWLETERLCGLTPY